MTTAPGDRPADDTSPLAPLGVDEVTGWDLTADVVVVGLGCAGACAAIDAAARGADVLVLEAAAMGGGTSAMSGGIIYLGGGTPVQEACGFTDTPEAMAAFLAAARASGVPLSVLALDDPALRERCGAGLVLVRPDQHVAWRGDRVEAPASLLSRVAGRAPRGDAERTA